MKKAIYIAVLLTVVGVMAAILIFNRKRMRSQSSFMTEMDRTEVVSTVKVSRTFMKESFSANGVTQACRELNVTSDVPGRVAEIFVREGDRVSCGTPLLKVDAELYEAEWLSARRACEALTDDERRLSRSHEVGGVSLQQLENIRTQLSAAGSRLASARKRLEGCTVKSPFPGVVNSRHVEVGALISSNTPLFEIIDDSRLKVRCHLGEDKVRLLRAGQAVEVFRTKGSGETFPGKISHVGRKSDRTLNYPVDVLLDGIPSLMAGVYVRVLFQEESGRDVILIPRKALIGGGDVPMAYVVKDGRVCRRELSLSGMTGDSLVVSGGLEPGEEIVLSGLMKIADGSEVRTVNDY